MMGSPLLTAVLILVALAPAGYAAWLLTDRHRPMNDQRRRQLESWLQQHRVDR